MVIKASAAGRIDALVADLASDSSIKRESAIARLSVIGARAVERLVALASSDAAPAARIAAFRALEGIGDRRAIDPALHALDAADPLVGVAALAAVRPFLQGPGSPVVLDRLAGVALDAARDERVRLAALQAVGDLDAPTVQPLWRALQRDANDAIRTFAAARAEGRPAVSSPDAAAELDAIAGGPLPDDPDGIRTAIGRAGDTVPLTTLHRLLEQIREREPAEPAGARARWTAARAAAHAALAHRGSRLALYDLRESLGRATAPLAVEFLSALATVGDASCLEPIAGAFVRAGGGGRAERDWWRRQLASAFRAIATRERITRRHAAMKKIEARWPGLLERL